LGALRDILETEPIGNGYRCAIRQIRTVIIGVERNCQIILPSREATHLEPVFVEAA
jgi:hypothetical protein